MRVRILPVVVASILLLLSTSATAFAVGHSVEPAAQEESHGGEHGSPATLHDPADTNQDTSTSSHSAAPNDGVVHEEAGGQVDEETGGHGSEHGATSAPPQGSRAWLPYANVTAVALMLGFLMLKGNRVSSGRNIGADKKTTEDSGKDGDLV